MFTRKTIGKSRQELRRDTRISVEAVDIREIPVMFQCLRDAKLMLEAPAHLSFFFF